MTGLLDATAPTSPVRASAGPAAARWRRIGSGLTLLGPAFVAGTAYVDPGNVATNFEAGSAYGYRLVWVVVGANLAAGLVQALAAKLGLATGRSLAELSRQRYPRPVAVALWVQAEIVVMATDLAEVVGGAIALHMLLGVPLPVGSLVTATVAFCLLALRRGAGRRFDLGVVGLFGTIVVGFAVCAVRARPSVGGLASGLVPALPDRSALVLATAVVGATVMPHAIHLHSALRPTAPAERPEARRRRALRLQRTDIGLAMGIAGLVNLAMLATAAGALPGVSGGVPALHSGLATAVGATGALLFAVALLASGLAASGVGTLAGDVVMHGYLGRRVPPSARRVVTVLPALALLIVGVSPTDALVLSQFVLGLGVPFTVVPLLLLTRDPVLMGAFVNRRRTTLAVGLVVTLVVVLAVGSSLSLLG